MGAAGKWLLPLRPWEQQMCRNSDPLIFMSRAVAHLPRVSGRTDKQVKLGGKDKALAMGAHRPSIWTSSHDYDGQRASIWTANVSSLCVRVRALA